MPTITPDDLAYGLRYALDHGVFALPTAHRLEMLLTRWEAQRATPDAGRAFARMWWRDHTYCVQTLAQLGDADRRELARSYIAYLKTNNAKTDLGEEQVLIVWQAVIDRQATAGAQQCAAD